MGTIHMEKSLGGIIWLQKPGIVKIDVPMHNYLVH